MQNSLHKVVRLHPKTFDAVVNPCIFSLSKKLKQSGNSKNVSNPNNNIVIAADLTEIHPRKETPEFREKLWHLEQYIGEINERYAVYEYSQSLIQSCSDLPIFTACSNLFTIMNDETCQKEERKLRVTTHEIEISVRKIQMNNREVEIIRFDNFAEVNQGISTGQNSYYIRRTTEGEGYSAVDMGLVLSQKEIEGLDTDEQNIGVNPAKYQGKCFIPYDKGGESDTDEGWLPNYYVEGKYFNDWSKKSLKRMRTLTIEKRKIEEDKRATIKKDDNRKIAAALRNQDKWFRTTINFSPTGQYSPTFRLGFGTIAQNTSSSILVPDDYKFFAMGVLCSRLGRFFFKNFLNHTIHTQEGDVMRFPFLAKKDSRIEELVKNIIKKQRTTFLYDYHSNEQKEIDRIIYSLYELNEEDIQEVEYWWARRYPKLARFADTKPRLSIKDKQEKIARLQEIIARGENKYCEFKSSLRLDIKKGTTEKYIEYTAFKNIAGFLNSEGGTLIIGVDDDKNILGLEETDYKTFSKADKVDEWSKHLDSLIQNFIGNKMHAFIKAPEFILYKKNSKCNSIEWEGGCGVYWREV